MAEVYWGIRGYAMYARYVQYRADLRCISNSARLEGESKTYRSWYLSEADLFSEGGPVSDVFRANGGSARSVGSDCCCREVVDVASDAIDSRWGRSAGGRRSTRVVCESMISEVSRHFDERDLRRAEGSVVKG
jgi:hypothetical protein